MRRVALAPILAIALLPTESCDEQVTDCTPLFATTNQLFEEFADNPCRELGVFADEDRFIASGPQGVTVAKGTVDDVSHLRVGLVDRLEPGTLLRVDYFFATDEAEETRTGEIYLYPDGQYAHPTLLRIETKGGTFIAAPSALSCEGVQCFVVVERDTTVSVTITPPEGKHLQGWAGNNCYPTTTGANQTNFDMSVDRFCKPVFADGPADLPADEVAIALNTDGAGMVRLSVDGAEQTASTITQNVPKGSNVQVTAVPGTSSVLETWTCNDRNPIAQGSFTITEIQSDLSCTATFKIVQEVPLRVQVTPGGLGSATVMLPDGTSVACPGAGAVHEGTYDVCNVMVLQHSVIELVANATPNVGAIQGWVGATEGTSSDPTSMLPATVMVGDDNNPVVTLNLVGVCAASFQPTSVIQVTNADGSIVYPKNSMDQFVVPMMTGGQPTIFRLDGSLSTSNVDLVSYTWDSQCFGTRGTTSEPYTTPNSTTNISLPTGSACQIILFVGDRCFHHNQNFPSMAEFVIE